MSYKTLTRQFRATEANQKWATDITYIHPLEGVLYLAAILDLFSKRIVDHVIRDHMEVSRCLQAVNEALETRRPPRGLVHRSDGGGQDTSREGQKMLDDNGLICSVSGKGECSGNACVESFWGRLKDEHEPVTIRKIKAEAKVAITDYIKRFFSVERIQKRLGYQSPIDYEMRAEGAVTAA